MDNLNKNRYLCGGLVAVCLMLPLPGSMAADRPECKEIMDRLLVLLTETNELHKQRRDKGTSIIRLPEEVRKSLQLTAEDRQTRLEKIEALKKEAEAENCVPPE